MERKLRVSTAAENFTKFLYQYPLAGDHIDVYHIMSFFYGWETKIWGEGEGIIRQWGQGVAYGLNSYGLELSLWRLL
jgi:hypothetical protein